MIDYLFKVWPYLVGLGGVLTSCASFLIQLRTLRSKPQDTEPSIIMPTEADIEKYGRSSRIFLAIGWMLLAVGLYGGVTKGSRSTAKLDIARRQLEKSEHTLSEIQDRAVVIENRFDERFNKLVTAVDSAERFAHEINSDRLAKILSDRLVNDMASMEPSNAAPPATQESLEALRKSIKDVVELHKTTQSIVKRDSDISLRILHRTEAFETTQAENQLLTKQIAKSKAEVDRLNAELGVMSKEIAYQEKLLKDVRAVSKKIRFRSGSLTEKTFKEFNLQVTGMLNDLEKSLSRDIQEVPK